MEIEEVKNTKFTEDTFRQAILIVLIQLNNNVKGICHKLDDINDNLYDIASKK